MNSDLHPPNSLADVLASEYADELVRSRTSGPQALPVHGARLGLRVEAIVVSSACKLDKGDRNLRKLHSNGTGKVQSGETSLIDRRTWYQPLTLVPGWKDPHLNELLEHSLQYLSCDISDCRTVWQIQDDGPPPTIITSY